MLRLTRSILIGVALAFLGHAPATFAHESRPAFLQISETAQNRYDVVWRTPLLSGAPLPVVLQFPSDVRNVTAPHTQEFPDSLVERRVIEVPGGLAGKRIEFVGLQGTITDVLVRVQPSDGNYSTTLVHPSQSWIEIAPLHGPLNVAGAYLTHGIEHILLGYDHLLFVFALILIVRSTRALIWTITAFTMAHSITLALATLGVVRVPGPPVEASIAFSILLLASEILRLRSGEQSLTARWPWIVAFCFGLLHGFGFASALSEIGLPRGDIPLALFAFNVGVELGQLVFIGVVLGAFSALRRYASTRALEARIIYVAPYIIGSLAGLWFVQRVATFL
jgi:hydrogenase/urease accessory protein HupE